MPRGRIPSPWAWVLLILRLLSMLSALVLLGITARLQVTNHSNSSFPVTYTGAAWTLALAAVEITTLASPANRIKRVSPLWISCLEIISIALFAAAIGTSIGEDLGQPNEVVTGEFPNQTFVFKQNVPLVLGQFVLQCIELGLAFVFMLVGCIECCRKGRGK